MATEARKFHSFSPRSGDERPLVSHWGSGSGRFATRVGYASERPAVRGKTERVAVANSNMRAQQRASGSSTAVVEWRRERLLAAGVAPEVAANLAWDCGVDLHALLELIDRGCPPDLAARILAPLGDRRRPC
jgi:hypothetical protein